MRDYDRAIVEFRKAQEMDRTFMVAHLWCGAAYERKGMYAEALTELEEATKLVGRTPFTEAFLAHCHALSGNTAEARRILDGLTVQAGRRYVPAFSIALIWVGLGEADRAFGWLDRAFEERSHWLTFLNVDPRFDPLRPDPRFDELRRRVGLPG
jgi:Flp pilus assembly protein TadD